jgi:putative membrane protein
MPLSDFDPRVFFAAERTLLAWIRTGITIIALGFVVARFGLFVQLLGTQSDVAIASTHPRLSAGLGITFILAGTLSILLAAVQHRRFIKKLSATDLPPAYSKSYAILIALMVAGLGVALACYLVVTQPT